jgi:hypothetical protein
MLCDKHYRQITIQKEVNTWSDNLISGMALWKKHLFTCALAASVAFEIFSL